MHHQGLPDTLRVEQRRLPAGDARQPAGARARHRRRGVLGRRRGDHPDAGGLAGSERSATRRGRARDTERRARTQQRRNGKTEARRTACSVLRARPGVTSSASSLGCPRPACRPASASRSVPCREHHVAVLGLDRPLGADRAADDAADDRALGAAADAPGRRWRRPRCRHRPWRCRPRWCPAPEACGFTPEIEAGERLRLCR